LPSEFRNGIAFGSRMTDNIQLTRRQCLARGAGAVVAAAAAAAGGYWLYDPSGQRGLVGDGGPRAVPHEVKDFFAGIDFPAACPRLSIATGAETRIEPMVRAAVDGLDPSQGIRRFIHPGDVVLIKPNAGFDRPPYLGATTHPEVLRAVIRLCKEAGAREVLVTDNPIESPAACFAKSGIGPVAEAEGTQLIVPREGQFGPLAAGVLPGSVGPPWPTSRADRSSTARAAPAATGPAQTAGLRPGLLDRWPIFYEPLERATKLIGIAPVKDHNLCSASMILKNWYGLLGGRRNQLHQAIHEVISDLALLFSPTLVIADATRVMMRSGPTGGRVSDVKPGGELGRPAVIAAVDPVACDAWCYENLLGRDPAQLAYLGLAAEKIAASGANRYGTRDWRAYDRTGQITVTST
jgi:uncharacterized protein (DUF362 family)